MSKAVYKKEFFDNVVRHNNTLNPNNKFLFDKRPVGASPKDFIQIENNPKKFGALAGKFVKEENYRAFADTPGFLDNLNNNSLYATFLGLKGMSQIAKTVYSPITQIRNATTASFFALANGNIGNGRDLVNSVKIIMSEINQRVMGKDPIVTTGSEQRLAKKSEIDNYYKKLIDLGVVNSNAKIGEFEDLLKDSVNGQSGNFLSKIPIGPKTDLLQVARNTQNRYMGKLYQGSDDVWKTYSWEMELGKLKNVFKKDPNATISLRDAKSRIELSEQGINPDAVRISQFDKNIADDLLEREAAQIVKDTVPNYARVPEFITKLRRLPFGNFIAFPAEILRTNTNILHQAVREIASESPEIRSIGMRRLTGSLMLMVVSVLL